MSAFYDETSSVALELLAEFGKPCAIKRIKQGPYDPATGATETTTVVELPMYAYFEPPNQTDYSSGLIQQTNEMAIFAAKDLLIEPVPGDLIRVASIEVDAWATFFYSQGAQIGNSLVTYGTVNYVKRIWSGEEVALWRCEVIR